VRVRKPIVAAIIVTSVALVAGAVVVADMIARDRVTEYVSERVHTALDLDAAVPVDVTIGGTSMLAQLIAGSIDSVDIAIDSVTVGQLSGAVKVHAEGVPTDENGAADSVAIELRVQEADVQTLAKSLSGAAVNSVEFTGNELTLSSSLSFFGLSLTVDVAVSPTVHDGAIDFAPTSLSLNGATTSTEALASFFGPLAAPLTAPRTVCVAQWLPADLTLQSVTIVDKELVVTITGTDVRLDAGALSETGHCP
jgi:hypothetical protein